MSGYPGYTNYGPYPPAAGNPPTIGYAALPGTQHIEVPQSFPPPYHHPQGEHVIPQPFYQGMYPPNPSMYHQLPPGPPPPPYYLQSQNPPNQSEFLQGFQASQYDVNRHQFAPYQPPNYVASANIFPNAPLLEDPLIQTSCNPINPISNSETHGTSHLDQELNTEVKLEMSGFQYDALIAPVAALDIACDIKDEKAKYEFKESLPIQEPKELSEKCTTTPIYFGTIKPFHPFEPKQDAEVLRKAMKGLGTDERSIVKILANRTQSQRTEIASVYQEIYHKKLVKKLKSDLSGNLNELIRALMMTRVRYYVKCLVVALNGRGGLQQLLVEVYFASTNAEIREINEIFKTELKTSLEKNLRREAKGYFGYIINSANNGTRDESQHVDQDKVKSDAEDLYTSRKMRWDHPDSVFTKLLIDRSYPHLRRVFEVYSKTAGRTLETDMKKRFSGMLLDGMLLIVSCIRNRVAFFAKCLYSAMKALKTDDSTIIRIVATRSEIDLKLIKESYLKMYQKSIEKDLIMITDGDYSKAFMEILKTN